MIDATISKRVGAALGRPLTMILLIGICLAGVASALAQTALPPGGLDTPFSPQADDTVYAVVVQPGNKILVGGNFTHINNTSRNYLARLNPDGSIDGSFTYLAGADNAVRALALQSDGRILVGGDFNSINGMNWAKIARLNMDGSVDSTFSQLSGANARVNLVAPWGGQVLVGGSFTKVNGVTRDYFARLTADGSLDANFNPSFNSDVYSAVVLPDSKILVGGDFTTLNGQPQKYLARLNSDGSPDATFTGSADLTVYSIVMQSGGRVVLGGLFGRVYNVYHSGLARLNSDGTLDSLFTAGTSGSVYSLIVQSNDQIVVAGRFNSVNNVTRDNLARLNANGLLDADFDAGQGPNYTVRSLALQDDGKILFGGDFDTVNAIDHGYVARLNGTPPPPVGADLSLNIWHAVEITWNSDATAQYQIQWAVDTDTNTWYNLGYPVQGNGSTNSVFDSTRETPHKIYRAKKL
jgi:uncharacterized delta-60 repeat protein